MTRYIALLRAINVGGNHTVKMDVLRQLFESLDFSGVETFIASGNVVFGTTSKNAQTLERKIAKRLREGLGYEVAAFIRSDTELAEIANYQPFRESGINDGADLSIVFLANAPDEELKQKVIASTTDTDEFHVHGREIYWLRHRKRGTATYSTVPLEKTLGRLFTIRGAKTVKRMAVKYASTKS